MFTFIRHLTSYIIINEKVDHGALTTSVGKFFVTEKSRGKKKCPIVKSQGNYFLVTVYEAVIFFK